MTAPVIIATPSGTHLATTGSAVALCGAELGRWSAHAVSLEPGADLGAKAGDCRECAKAWGGVR